MQRNGRILIVEDEKISAEYLKEILEINGFTVVGICDTGADAISSALALKPDIIFMDIMLKDSISGSEAAVRISSHIETKIIFLSSYSNEEMIEYALDAGAFNYLIKPFEEKQILVTLQMALNQQNKTSKNTEKACEYLSGNYCYNYKNKKLYHEQHEVDIGNKSLRLIGYLCEHINTTVSNEELSLYIYGEKKDTSALRTLISRLKKTLSYDLISNNSGTGYKITN